MQENFVEIIPGSSGGLDQYGSLRIGNIDPSFSAWHLLEQVTLAGDACSRIRRAIGAELLCDRRARHHEHEERRGKRHEANACKERHGDHPPLVLVLALGSSTKACPLRPRCPRDKPSAS